MIKLIDRYGIEIVKKGKNCYYSPELKQEIIDKVLLEADMMDLAKPNPNRKLQVLSLSLHLIRVAVM